MSAIPDGTHHEKLERKLRTKSTFYFFTSSFLTLLKLSGVTPK